MNTSTKTSTTPFFNGFTASYIYDNPFRHAVAKPTAARQLESIGSIAKSASDDYLTFIGAVTYDVMWSPTSIHLHVDEDTWKNDGFQNAVFFEMEKWVVWKDGRLQRDADGEVIRKKGYHEHLIAFINHLPVAA